MNDQSGPNGRAAGLEDDDMGELITVDFRAGKVISRVNYWRDAEALHREALARFTGRTGEI